MAETKPKTTRKRKASAKKSESTEALNDFGGSYIARTEKRVQPPFLKGLLFILVIGLVAGFIGYYSGNLGLGKKNDMYHAVFLQNGQVFFGKLGKSTADTLELDNVYYVQTVNQEVQQPDGSVQVVPQPRLFKKGDEYYGPGTSITINKSQITVIEELRDDSQVLQDIRASQ